MNFCLFNFFLFMELIFFCSTITNIMAVVSATNRHSIFLNSMRSAKVWSQSEIFSFLPLKRFPQTFSVFQFSFISTTRSFQFNSITDCFVCIPQPPSSFLASMEEHITETTQIESILNKTLVSLLFLLIIKRVHFL